MFPIKAFLQTFPMNFCSSDQLNLLIKLMSYKLHIYLQKPTKMQVNKYKGDSFQKYKCYNIPVEDQADHHSQSVLSYQCDKWILSSTATIRNSA